MTPASTLSRLEKLADANYGPIPKEEFFGGDFSQHEAFMAGGKAFLQILSEPGEDCGPRRFVGQGNSECSDTYATLAPLFPTDTAYVTEALLLQAKAAHEAEVAKLNAIINFAGETAKKLNHSVYDNAEKNLAQLASSEARVRILSEALEKIARPHPQQREPDLEYYQALATQRRKCAAEALLEVKR